LRCERQRNALRLNGNTALTLDSHGIQYLRSHFAVGKAATELDKSIRNGRFPMVNVCDD
jgi:hypothetical protein